MPAERQYGDIAERRQARNRQAAAKQATSVRTDTCPLVRKRLAGASERDGAAGPAATCRRLRAPSSREAPPVWLFPGLFVVGLTVALTFILAFQFIPGQVQISEGEVAKQNIRSPQKLSYVSQIKTKEAKDKALLAVADVYDYDPSLAQQQKAKATAACQSIATIRYDFQSTADQKRDRLSKLADLRLTDKAISETLAVTDSTLQAVCSEGVRVVEEVMRDRLRPADAAEVRARPAGRFNPASPAAQLSRDR